MARIALATHLIVLTCILASCGEPDSGRAQLQAKRLKQASDRHLVIQKAQDNEADIVEQMTLHRRSYREYLLALIKHYRKGGNYMKREWAEKELAALDAIPQYNYIIEASVAGPDLKATQEIPEADDLYYQALALEDKAKKLVVITDKELLRLALDKFNELIRQYPTSDKIDDAAYRAARIYEEFKDYSIALLYYQRTYQWDPDTVYPARYRAAYVLDRRLHRRDEALELYKQALRQDSLTGSQREFIEERITEFTQSKEVVK